MSQNAVCKNSSVVAVVDDVSCLWKEALCSAAVFTVSLELRWRVVTVHVRPFIVVG